MKWIIVLIFFNDGLHYAQTQPYFYKNYDVCEAAASEVKKVYSKKNMFPANLTMNLSKLKKILK